MKDINKNNYYRFFEISIILAINLVFSNTKLTYAKNNFYNNFYSNPKYTFIDMENEVNLKNSQQPKLLSFSLSTPDLQKLGKSENRILKFSDIGEYYFYIDLTEFEYEQDNDLKIFFITNITNSISYDMYSENDEEKIRDYYINQKARFPKILNKKENPKRSNQYFSSCEELDSSDKALVFYISTVQKDLTFEILIRNNIIDVSNDIKINAKSDSIFLYTIDLENLVNENRDLLVYCSNSDNMIIGSYDFDPSERYSPYIISNRKLIYIDRKDISQFSGSGWEIVSFLFYQNSENTNDYYIHFKFIDKSKISFINNYFKNDEYPFRIGYDSEYNLTDTYILNYYTRDDYINYTLYFTELYGKYEVQILNIDEIDDENLDKIISSTNEFHPKSTNGKIVSLINSRTQLIQIKAKSYQYAAYMNYHNCNISYDLNEGSILTQCLKQNEKIENNFNFFSPLNNFNYELEIYGQYNSIINLNIEMCQNTSILLNNSNYKFRGICENSEENKNLKIYNNGNDLVILRIKRAISLDKLIVVNSTFYGELNNQSIFAIQISKKNEQNVPSYYYYNLSLNKGGCIIEQFTNINYITYAPSSFCQRPNDRNLFRVYENKNLSSELVYDNISDYIKDDYYYFIISSSNISSNSSFFTRLVYEYYFVEKEKDDYLIKSNNEIYIYHLPKELNNKNMMLFIQFFGYNTNDFDEFYLQVNNKTYNNYKIYDNEWYPILYINNITELNETDDVTLKFETIKFNAILQYGIFDSTLDEFQNYDYTKSIVKNNNFTIEQYSNERPIKFNITLYPQEKIGVSDYYIYIFNEKNYYVNNYFKFVNNANKIYTLFKEFKNIISDSNETISFNISYNDYNNTDNLGCVIIAKQTEKFHAIKYMYKSFSLSRIEPIYSFELNNTENSKCLTVEGEHTEKTTYTFSIDKGMYYILKWKGNSRQEIIIYKIEKNNELNNEIIIYNSTEKNESGMYKSEKINNFENLFVNHTSFDDIGKKEICLEIKESNFESNFDILGFIKEYYIYAIIIGVCLLLLIIALILCCIRSKKRKNQEINSIIDKTTIDDIDGIDKELGIINEKE